MWIPHSIAGHTNYITKPQGAAIGIVVSIMAITASVKLQALVMEFKALVDSRTQRYLSHQLKACTLKSDYLWSDTISVLFRCVTFGKMLFLCLNFLICETEMILKPSDRLFFLWAPNATIIVYVKHLQWCLAHNKHFINISH